MIISIFRAGISIYFTNCFHSSPKNSNTNQKTKTHIEQKKSVHISSFHSIPLEQTLCVYAYKLLVGWSVYLFVSATSAHHRQIVHHVNGEISHYYTCWPSAFQLTSLTPNLTAIRYSHSLSIGKTDPKKLLSFRFNPKRTPNSRAVNPYSQRFSDKSLSHPTHSTHTCNTTSRRFCQLNSSICWRVRMLHLVRSGSCPAAYGPPVWSTTVQQRQQAALPVVKKMWEGRVNEEEERPD